MKRKHGQFNKKTLAIAVLAAMTGTAQADVDAWGFSGQNARSAALQSNYFNLNDSYNIWVNPALVTQYSNRADLNVTDGIRDDESAGAFLNWGDHSFGAYFGRPSVSYLNEVSFIGTFNSLGDYAASQTGAAVQPTLNVDTPRNQFDLFWGWNAPGPVKFGARFNFQALSEEDTYPTYTDTNPNQFQATDVTRTTDTVSTNRGETSSREINLALGAVDAGGLWDAAFLYGRPTAESTAKFADQRVFETLVAGTITTRDTDAFNGKQNISDDGARNIGLAGRLHNIIPNTIISLNIQRQGYGYANKINGTVRNQADANADGTLAAVDGDTDVSTNFTEKGEFTNEGGGWMLAFTQNFTPTPQSMILASLGLTSWSWESRTVNKTTVNSVTDNLNATTTYNNFTPYLGKQTDEKITSDYFALPLVVGVEAGVTATTKFRAAISKNLYQSESTETKTVNYEFPATGTPGSATATETIQTFSEKNKETRVWDTDTILTLGAGYAEGSLSVDAVLEKAFVTQGVDNGLVSRVTATWLIQ